MDGTAVTIDVAFFSDFHGQLSASGAALSCAIDTVRAANPDTVVISNGDSIGGSAFESSVQADQPTIEYLNLIGLNASNLGNHEFDRGMNFLVTNAVNGAEFPYFSNNVTGAAEGQDALDAFAPYYIYESNGVSIAFVGTTTTDTPNIVSAGGVDGLAFQDIYTSTNSMAAQLSDGDAGNGEADVVIAVTHAGYQGFDFAQFSGDVDAVFTGHTHQNYVGTGTNEAGVAMPVIEPNHYGQGLGHLVVTVDTATGDVTLSAGEVIATAACEPVDPAVTAFLAEVQQDSELAGQVPVGEITADILRGETGGNRGTESTAGNFLADVALWQVGELTGGNADIGIMNPGGIRADYIFAGDTENGGPENTDGVVTYQEAYNMQNFGNTSGSVDLTGAQFVQLLEQQWRPGQDRPMLRLGISSNVRYEFDPAAEYGSHITGVWVNGQPLDPAATYTVASNTFLLGGQDGFTVLAEGTNFVETGAVDLQGTLDYLQAFSPVEPDYVQRSIGITDLLADGDDGTASIESGEDIAIDLSSLRMSNGEPGAETVTVYFDGKELGTFPVDASAQAVDVTGTAQVRVTIPDLSGYADGTEVPFTIVGDNGEEFVSWVYVINGDDDTTPAPSPEPSEEPSPAPTTPGTTGTQKPPASLANTGIDGNAASTLGLVAAGLTLTGLAALVTRRRLAL